MSERTHQIDKGNSLLKGGDATHELVAEGGDERTRKYEESPVETVAGRIPDKPTTRAKSEKIRM